MSMTPPVPIAAIHSAQQPKPKDEGLYPGSDLSKDDDDGGISWVWLIVGCVAALLLILIIASLCKCRRNRVCCWKTKG